MSKHFLRLLHCFVGQASVPAMKTISQAGTPAPRGIPALVAALLSARMIGLFRGGTAAATLICALALLSLAAPLSAQVANPPVGVPVKIWANGNVSPDSGCTGNLSVSGYFLSPPPGTADIYASGNAATDGDASAYLTTELTYAGQPVRVEPEKDYTVTISGSYLADGDLNIVAPPGYRVLIDGMARHRTTFNGYGQVRFLLQPLRARHPSLTGLASSVTSGEINWHVSLGNLRNGASAGDLALIDTGTASNWGPVFTPGRLEYEAPSDEIYVYRVNNQIRQIVANQVAVDIVTPETSTTSYEIKCYNPTQLLAGAYPRAFTGSPFATYRIERDGSDTAIKFTHEVREVTDATTLFPIVRREIMKLARTGTWPVCTWTKTDWTLEGQTAATETVVQGTGTPGNRTENILVHAPGSSTAALQVTRNYTRQDYPNDCGEVLSSETVGSTNGLAASFNYYTDIYQWGSFGYLKSVALPGGGWTAFDYYDAGSGAGFGRIAHRYRPSGNAPATATLSTTQGEVTSFTYTNDIFGAQTRPASVYTTVNNVCTAYTAMSYNDTATYANGYYISQTSRADYSAAGMPLTAVTNAYRDDVPDAFIRGQLYSVLQPTGVKQSYVYQRGTWNGTSFTLGGSGIGTGTASRIAVVTGTQNSGTACSILFGSTVDTVYLIPGKSTMEAVIRDSRALVVRAENYAWVSNAWQLVAYTNFTYDFVGRLVARTASNGATYTANYANGLKTDETDESGITTSFAYDAAGRTSGTTRAGQGAIGALATSFTYDALDRVLEQRVGSGQTEQLVTTAQFDDAGRVTTETAPGVGATLYSYNVAGRSTTITRPDGGTITKACNLDGSPASVTGTATVPRYFSYGVETDGRRYTQTNIGVANSPRWHKSWADWLGRTVMTSQPGFGTQPNYVENYYYNTAGQLNIATRTGYVSTSYAYGPLGNLTDTYTGGRQTGSDYGYESFNNAWWLHSESYGYASTGRFSTGVSRTRLTGFIAGRFGETQMTDAEGNLTTVVTDANRAARTATVTTTSSGYAGSQVQSLLNGFTVSATSFDGLTSSTTYDALLRPRTVTDSRGNTTTTAYYAGTAFVQSVTDATATVVATYGYDTLGRTILSRDAQNHTARSAYNQRDQLVQQWGDAVIPVQYGYDATYGDRTTQSTFRGGTGWDGATWPASPGTADTTTWTYHAATGLLTAKTDAANRSVTQTYNAAGQTATRTLARGVTATYTYDTYGAVTGISYSDSTPAVAYTYDPSFGQLTGATDYAGTRQMLYDTAKPWRLSAEALGDYYGQRVLTRLYDTTGLVGRVHGFQAGSTVGSNSELEQTFAFTATGRFEGLSTLRSGLSTTSRTFHYGYEANSTLLKTLTADGSPFSVTRTYETQRDVLTAIDSKWSATSRTRYDFTSDTLGQRLSAKQSGDVFGDYGDATFQLYAYNARGELTDAAGYLGSNIADPSQPLPGRRHQYGYDNAGNRQWANHTGVPDLREDYTTNALNQYTTKENNTLPVSGTAAADAKVAVSGRPVPAARKGRFWSDEVIANNVLGPWRGPLSIFTAKPGAGSGGADLFRVDSRMAQVAQALQSFTYDADGNLTSDGLMDYQWDAENRLVRMATTSLAVSCGLPNRALEFRYDYLGRRVLKRNLSWNLTLGTWNLDSERRFLYDGWNLVAEYVVSSPSSGSPTLTLFRSYTWGLDLTGSTTGAGGVGALVQIADHASGKTYFPTYDGNGNVAALLNADTGALAAAYEYSPYGEPLRAQAFDPTVADQPFRFSTKFTDVETGLVYYGHRYYSPSLGRFINRDPIEEQGGINLYGFCGNNAVNRWDYLGNWPSKPANMSNEEWSWICGWINQNEDIQGDDVMWGAELAFLQDVQDRQQAAINEAAAAQDALNVSKDQLVANLNAGLMSAASDFNGNAMANLDNTIAATSSSLSTAAYTSVAPSIAASTGISYASASASYTANIDASIGKAMDNNTVTIGAFASSEGATGTNQTAGPAPTAFVDTLSDAGLAKYEADKYDATHQAPAPSLARAINDSFATDLAPSLNLGKKIGEAVAWTAVPGGGVMDFAEGAAGLYVLGRAGAKALMGAAEAGAEGAARSATSGVFQASIQVSGGGSRAAVGLSQSLSMESAFATIPQVVEAAGIRAGQVATQVIKYAGPRWAGYTGSAGFIYGYFAPIEPTPSSSENPFLLPFELGSGLGTCVSEVLSRL
jgi:RHS repeat-associated protein